MYLANTKEKKAGPAVRGSEKVDFSRKKINRDTEGHSIVIE